MVLTRQIWNENICPFLKKKVLLLYKQNMVRLWQAIQTLNVIIKRVIAH